MKGAGIHTRFVLVGIVRSADVIYPTAYVQAVKEGRMLSAKEAAQLVYEARFSSFGMRCWSCLRKIQKAGFIAHFALRTNYAGGLPDPTFWCSIDCLKNLEGNGTL